jgi:RNA polymerase sigma-70 factor, ECF subfamily
LLAFVDPLWSGTARQNRAHPIATGPLRLTSMPQSRVAETAPLAALLARCGTGDAAAFRSVYDLQSARLYGIALRITRQPSLAADAVHDAFMQVWQRAARFDEARGSAEAWLTGLVRYRAIDILRKTGRETTGAMPIDGEDDGPGPLEALLASTEGAALHRCIEQLDPSQRRSIMLAFIEGLSHSEIAARIATPLGTVKSWVRRGLIALRECLGG